MAEVAQDLGLGGVALGPLPLGLELGVEAVGVVDALDVAASARVAVPVPGAADVVGALDPDRGEAEPAETVEQVEPGEAGTHHHDVDVRIPDTSHVHVPLRRSWRIARTSRSG